MKAVLLAGGAGTRLSPLTLSRPKPLMRVLDRPVVEYSLAALKAAGIDEAVVTTHYLAEKVESALGSRSCGVSLSYLREQTPLGTAGAVKAAADALDGDFLVLSGDALFDFDLSRARQAHEKSGALVTLLLVHRDDVLEYGVVRTHKDGRIAAFLEKPDWQSVCSDLVNTGIYLCKKELLSYLATGEQADFSTDLFPRLLREEGALYGTVMDGYWCDIGSPAALYGCNMDALAARVKLPLLAPGRFVGEGEERSFVADGVRILSRARFSHSVLGAGTRLCGCTVSDTVLGQGCLVDEDAHVLGALCGDSVVLERKSTVGAGTVLSDSVCVRQKSALSKNSAVAPFERVENAPAALFSDLPPLADSEYSYFGPAEGRHARLYALGVGFARVYPQRLALCYRDDFENRLAALLCAEGVLCQGGQCMLFAVSSEQEARFLGLRRACPALCFCANKQGGFFAVFSDEYGLPLARGRLRAVSRAMHEEVGAQEAGVAPVCEHSDEYERELFFRLGRQEGVTLSLPQTAESAPFRRAFVARGGALDTVGLSYDPATARLCLAGESLGADAMRLLLLTRAAHTGRRTVLLREGLPQSTLRALSQTALSFVYPKSASAAERALHLHDFYLFDPWCLLAQTLALLAARGGGQEAFSALCRAVDDPCFVSEEFSFSREKSARLFTRLWEHGTEQDGGLFLSVDEHGRTGCQLAPGRITLRAEGRDMEAARELCERSMEQLRLWEESL